MVGSMTYKCAYNGLLYFLRHSTLYRDRSETGDLALHDCHEGITGLNETSHKCL